MANKLIKSVVLETANVKYVKRPSLYAKQCDICGKIFHMDKYCNDSLTPGELQGTFDECANDNTGKGMGNIFHADVCSFICADKMFNGEWKKLERFAPYIKVNANLIRVSLGLTSFVKDETHLIDDWETNENEIPDVIAIDSNPTRSRYSRYSVQPSPVLESPGDGSVPAAFNLGSCVILDNGLTGIVTGLQGGVYDVLCGDRKFTSPAKLMRKAPANVCDSNVKK